MFSLSAVICGYLLDLCLGDPPTWPHPIRWIGKLITLVQTKIRLFCHSETALKWGGLLLWLIVVGSTYVICWGFLTLLRDIVWLQWCMQTLMIYSLLATRCLRDCAMDVYNALQYQSLEQARIQLSYIVGRETSQLTAEQISRATVETVAENSVDGVISPLFFLFIGGVPLAMAYKAVNTLDSMVGYTIPKYKSIGYVSARMDDLANWLPARLSWLFLSLASGLSHFNFWQAIKIGWRDRYNHKSPNCAWPEATVAGALGIRLGGPNVYFGEQIDKPWIGDQQRVITVQDIKHAIRLMYLASILALGSFSLLFLLIHNLR